MTPIHRNRAAVLGECRKEFVLKTISRRFGAWIVLGLGVGACAPAALASGIPAVAVGLAVVAQAEESDLSPEDRRLRATELMAAARQSMKSGDFDAAQLQVERAEGLEPTFGVLHLGDTPKKVRQDLERQRAKAQAPKGMLQKLSPFRKSREKSSEGEENPFAGRPEAQDEIETPVAPARAGAAWSRNPNALAKRAAAAQRAQANTPVAAAPSRLPGTKPVAQGERATAATRQAEDVFAEGDAEFGEQPVERISSSSPRSAPVAASRAVAPAATENVAGRQPMPAAVPPASQMARTPAASGDSPKVQSDRLLLSARRALARGDTRRAQGYVDQAQALGVAYALNDDSPAKIAAAIDRQLSLNEQRPANGQSKSFRREQADFMMEQAEALLHYRDYDEAERLAQDVTRLGVEFGPYDADPRRLLDRIAADRRGTLGQAANGAGNVARTAPPAGSDATRLAKARALELLAASRAALGVGDLRQANRLARQAEALHVPDNLFAAGDDRPALVLQEIESAQRNGGVRLAGGNEPARPGNEVEHALHTPHTDLTHNEQVGADEAAGASSSAAFDFPPETAAGAPSAPGTSPSAAAEPAIFPPSGASPAANAPPVADPAAAPKTLKNNSPDVMAADLQQALGLIERGENSLAGGDRNTALVYFRQAGAFSDALPPDIRQRLQGHLTQLDQTSAPPVAAEQMPDPTPPATETAEEPPLPAAAPGHLPGSLLNKTAEDQQLASRQLSAQVSRGLSEARKLREGDDPKRALEILKELRAATEGSSVDDVQRKQYLLRIDRAVTETERYLVANRAKIELKEQNAETKAQVDREQNLKVEVDNKLAGLVEEFNQLMDDRRYAEADLIARKAEEMAPDNPVVQQLKWTSRFSRRAINSGDLRDAKEAGFVDALTSVEEASEPFDDRNPISFGNPQKWDDMTKRRKGFPGDETARNERELEIMRKLRTPVSLQFKEAPLVEVLNYLAKLAEINLHIDQLGLSEEGVTTDTPVTIDLNQEISLKSALNLILEELHLSYIIKDEVLKVTSEQFKDGNIVPKTYPVADLVIPIPNFVPGPRMGMSSALAEAYNTLGYNGAPGFGGQSPMAVVASRDGTSNAGVINPSVLAQTQVGDNRGTLAGSLAGATQPVGPGGAGGGAAADYDSLIRLITTTIAPTTWDEVGGQGAISPFKGNLSLVVSNTEEVHDQIRDLLQQLRRLQDLQVTIEVRFITLNDNFFERIGIDFDFDINSNIDRPYQIFGRTDPNASTTYTSPPFGTNGGVPRDTQDRNLTRSQAVSVGLAAPNVFSSDLDVPFRQDSFTLAVPQFGGFDPSAGASFGFAILSEVESYFFLNAAQGDRRSNVLQAPKVTLFNGQQATVSDTSQSPFVISVIPVVGDFAAAQQPVIIILSEGTFMTVQAVVSSDRRFVRLTIVPFFSHIGEVDTFTFNGSSTTTETSKSDGPEDDTTSRDNEKTTITEGTTVQLPTFSFVTVTTTVSVPDGGTVLLGGIKRLSEGRTEFGVPILNKLPYVSRLFKNVGIGRETESLMMMVTPRIIIQEEEESLLGLNPAPAAAP